MNNYIKDITGKKFGKLSVLSYSHTDEKSRNAFWNCLCDCGKEKCVNGHSLKRLHTASCGCSFPHNKSHNRTGSSEYYIWRGMKSRCNDINHVAYKDYGGRGINICEEWMDFKNFYKDIGNRPSKDHSIERIDNDKGYCKENCKWGTKEEQSNNRRNSIIIEYQGEKLSLSQWCRRLNIPIRRTKMRFLKKWPLDRVFHAENFTPYLNRKRTL